MTLSSLTRVSGGKGVIMYICEEQCMEGKRNSQLISRKKT